MAAEWELRAYRVDHALLSSLVRGGGEHHKKLLARIARNEFVAGDDRLAVDLSTALEEIARGHLVNDHKMTYRIALEAILEATAPRVKFRLNEKAKKTFASVVTYADKDLVPDALKVCGLKVLAKLWVTPQPRFPNPKLDLKPVFWPWATFIDRELLDAAAAELTRLSCDGEPIAAPASAVAWVHPTKDRMLVELTNKTYALLSDAKRKRLIVEGPLDEVLASVPDDDFESVVKQAKAKTRALGLCPSWNAARWDRVSHHIIEKLDLDEFDADVVDVVRALAGIVTALSLAVPKDPKLPFFTGTRSDGVMLCLDGEQ